GSIACRKVDFEIPEQSHGRHIAEISSLVEEAALPANVKASALAVFRAIAEVEGDLHGIPPDEVHLHEVGAVDAILDVVGAVWGLEELGVSAVYSGPISLGDGFVKAAHGVLPVPAPATLRLLEGHIVRPGPEGSGELVTPTGAALVKVLSRGGPPERYVPRRSGFGAGTKDLRGRANALRIVLAEEVPQSSTDDESLVLLTTDIDDMSPELLADAAERLRADGALDVVLLATQMKKGRAATRLEALVREGDVRRIEALIFEHTSTLGIRRVAVQRRALQRAEETVEILGHRVRLKIAELPNGTRRSKPEFDDVRTVSLATGRSMVDVGAMAVAAAERGVAKWVGLSPARTSRLHTQGDNA
ncbi:MAG: nickel pincer cofactor biosynthesis protein LarC, partial [Gemmatimonadaceae bacterium]